MADFDSVRQTIDASIKQNGTGAITGPVLNGVLNEMVDAADEQVSQLGREVDERFGGTVVLNPGIVDGVMVLSTITAQSAFATYYVPVSSGEDIHVKFTLTNNALWVRYGYTSQIPAAGVAVTGYRDGHSVNTTLTPPIDGYFVICTEKANEHTIEITKEVQGVEQDIATLQTQVAANTTAITQNADNIKDINRALGTPQNYKSTIASGTTNVSLVIDVRNLQGLVVNVSINSSPLSGTHSVYRARTPYSSGIIDGMSCEVGASINVEITSETNYLWIFKAGSVATTSDIDVTLYNLDGAKQIADKLYDAASFEYLYESGVIYISKHSGDKDLVISFGNGSGNNLWDFRGFYTKEHGARLVAANLTRIHTNSSDWFAPFKIRAVNNIDGDDYGQNPYNEYFTGGAHQYNNGISGSTPTARGTSATILIDGKPRSSTWGIGNKLKMSWTNYIQAYNTRKADGSGREVLQEDITLEYDGVKWIAETILKPLEDINLDLWYGYQTTGVGETMSTHWRFINAVNRAADQTNSGNYNAIGFDTYGGQVNVRCIIDNGVDLGNRAQVFDNSEQGAFKSGTKLYFTIANKWEVLNANNYYYLKGTYYIERP